MDDHPEIDIDKELSKPVSDLTRKFYRDILKSMEDTNKQARATLAEVQELLVDIAGIVASEWMHEQRGVKMRDHRQILISELIPIVRGAAIDAHIEMTRIRENNKDADHLKAENLKLAARVESMEHEKASLDLVLENSDALVKSLRNQLAAVEAGDRTEVVTAGLMMLPTSEEELPAHYQKFIGERGSADANAVIKSTGDSGEIRSPDLRRAIAAQFGGADVDGRGGRATDAIELCEKYGIVRKYKPDKQQGRNRGRPIDIYYLAPIIGAYFYEQLTGKQYAPPEHLKNHKSYAQSILVIEAEKLLRENDYEIHKAHQLKQGDGTAQFYPDITASKDGVMIYCEVERATPRENQNPDAKWRNFRHYTNGQMYVFYKDQKSKQASSRYAQIAMQHPNDVVYLCDLNIARDHLAEKGTIWTDRYAKSYENRS
jgi:hypothetical protein